MPKKQSSTPMVQKASSAQMMTPDFPEDSIRDGVIYQHINDGDDHKAGIIQYGLYPVDPTKSGGDHYQKLERIGFNVNYYQNKGRDRSLRNIRLPKLTDYTLNFTQQYDESLN